MCVLGGRNSEAHKAGLSVSALIEEIRTEIQIVTENWAYICPVIPGITPNGDGYFDTWKVLGVDNDYYDVVKVQIFNRFGKLISEITDKNHLGWDGVYNGNTLPTNDYWYNAELIDKNGKTRKKTGYFSLLRK